MHMGTLDLTVVAIYTIVLLTLAQWVSREKAGHEKDSSDYFLAGRSLPWWTVGESLIAANISAEQIIGMSGSAWVMGIVIGACVWLAACGCGRACWVSACYRGYICKGLIFRYRVFLLRAEILSVPN